MDAQVNVVGTANVLKAARVAGARVPFASSGGHCTAETPPSLREEVLPLPESPYGIAKYCAEQYIGLDNRYGTRHSILRPANVYGPATIPPATRAWSLSSAVASWPARSPTIYGDGAQTRDLVYVADAVSAFLAAADSGLPAPGTPEPGRRSAFSNWSPSSPGSPAARSRRGSPPPGVGDLKRSSLAVDRVGTRSGLASGDRRSLTAWPGVYRWIEAGTPWTGPAASRSLAGPR